MRRIKVAITFSTPVLGGIADSTGISRFFRDESGCPCILGSQIVGAVTAAARSKKIPFVPFSIEDDDQRTMLAIPVTATAVSIKSRMKRPPGSLEMVETKSESMIGTAEFWIASHDPDTVVRLLEFAGRVIGIGQNRKAGYGRFLVERVGTDVD